MAKYHKHSYLKNKTTFKLQINNIRKNAENRQSPKYAISSYIINYFKK